MTKFVQKNIVENGRSKVVTRLLIILFKGKNDQLMSFSYIELVLRCIA